jgi:SAM-dependent methyltransferase
VCRTGRVGRASGPVGQGGHTAAVTSQHGDGYPAWFFERDDPSPDTGFYGPTRLVTHIDDAAIRAVGELYRELGVDGSAAEPQRVLDLMSSWVSHLLTAPAELVALGLNAAELEANPMASSRIVRDLNAEPTLPFEDATFDAVLCCVSIDYLVHPVEVLTEVARVLRPGAPVVLTFSNRCFPSKAIHGWLAADDAGRGAIVVDYLRRVARFSEPELSLRTPAGRYRGDPLYAVVARRLPQA